MTYSSNVAFANARWSLSDAPSHALKPTIVPAPFDEIREYAPAAAGPLWPFLANDIDRARAAGELAIIYQPIVDSRTCTIVAYEALARWTHPRFGVISPNHLMAVAAASGEMDQLGQWVLEAACHAAATWDSQLSLCVNLTLGQLQNPELPTTIAELLARSNLPATRLQIEVSDHCELENIWFVAHSLSELREIGVRITLDDFGVGSANLTALCCLPVDTIKIHRSIVEALDHDERMVVIARSMIDLAHDLDLAVIADGVETTAQMRFLRTHGCQSVQGFLIAQPRVSPMLRVA